MKHHDKDFYDKPIDITEEYPNIDDLKFIKCGKSYTVIVKKDETI